MEIQEPPIHQNMMVHRKENIEFPFSSHDMESYKKMDGLFDPMHQKNYNGSEGGMLTPARRIVVYLS